MVIYCPVLYGGRYVTCTQSIVWWQLLSFFAKSIIILLACRIRPTTMTQSVSSDSNLLLAGLQRRQTYLSVCLKIPSDTCGSLPINNTQRRFESTNDVVVACKKGIEVRFQRGKPPSGAETLTKKKYHCCQYWRFSLNEYYLICASACFAPIWLWLLGMESFSLFKRSNVVAAGISGWNAVNRTKTPVSSEYTSRIVSGSYSFCSKSMLCETIWWSAPSKECLASCIWSIVTSGLLSTTILL